MQDDAAVADREDLAANALACTLAALPGAVTPPLNDRRVVAALNISGQANRTSARAMQDNLLPALPPARELDMLMTAGERISMALVAMAIGRESCWATSTPAIRKWARRASG